MFCPNCGTQNNDAAAKCQSCGFTLQKVGGQPKFKGTMLMMNAPASPSAPPGPASQAAVTNPSPAAAEPPRPQSRLKGTMIGVAPPSMGGATAGTMPSMTPSTAPAALHPSSTPPAMGTAPTEQMPATSPHSFGGAERVNPLGGTMVASQISSELQANIAASLANPGIGQPPSTENPGMYTPPTYNPTMQSPEQPMQGSQSSMTVLQILLSIFTFGIYYFVVVKKQR